MQLRPPRRRPVTLPPPPPKKHSKSKWILYSLLGLVGFYAYVFVYSPASCQNVKKKIDKTVNKSSKEHVKRAIKGKEDPIPRSPGTHSLSLNIPSTVTGNYDDEILTREYLMARTVQGTVKRREKFTSSLIRNGVDPTEAKRVVATFESQSIFNFRRAQPGQRFWVKLSLDGKKLFSFRYHYGPRVVLLAERTAKGFKARKIRHPIRLVVYGIGFTIQKSLAKTLGRLGERYSLVKKLAALFSDEIQLRELREGDEIKLLVQKRMLKKRFIGYGTILAARLNTREKGEYTVFYSPPGGYFTQEGTSFFRVFLSRPLPGNTPPEKDSNTGGVIFPAAKRPAVWALSSGVVHAFGWAGKLGRRVVIEHPGEIRTVYYHLSGFSPGLKKGKRVSRRQVIGRAGFSGTTPDRNGVGVLVYQKGRLVSHYSITSLREPGVPPERRASFEKSVDLYKRQLEQLKIVGEGVSKRIQAVKESTEKRRRSRKKRKRARRGRRRQRNRKPRRRRRR